MWLRLFFNNKNMQYFFGKHCSYLQDSLHKFSLKMGFLKLFFLYSLQRLRFIILVCGFPCVHWNWWDVKASWLLYDDVRNIIRYILIFKQQQSINHKTFFLNPLLIFQPWASWAFMGLSSWRSPCLEKINHTELKWKFMTFLSIK